MTGPVGAIGARLRAVQRAAGRITGTPLLVRAAVFGCVLLALALAVPAEFLAGRPLGLLVAVAALPAIAPRRTWTTAAVLVAVAGWLLATTAYGRAIEPWRLLALSAALYLAHSLAALAALLPYDAVVDPAVLARWLGRAVAVAFAAVPLGLGLLLVAGLVGGGSAVPVTLAGSAVAAGLAGLLGWLARRR